MSEKKIRVVVIYGGKSTEHEISCRSAAYVLKNLDQSKYDVYALAIDKDGCWIPQNTETLLCELDQSVAIKPPLQKADLPILPSTANPGESFLVPVFGKTDCQSDVEKTVVFPVLHGTYGEDGSIQGLFDLGEVAYVGASTLGSALSMDKVVAKKLVSLEGVKVVPYLSYRKHQWLSNPQAVIEEIISKLSDKLFIKPASLGSSVGVSKVADSSDLEKALEEAFRFDEKVLVEKALQVREIECAVMGGYEPEVSEPGEVVTDGFYSYETKYIDTKGAKIAIPADLTKEQSQKAKELARKCFKALELYGLSRVDLFLTKDGGEFYFNEVNTMPGFTELSQFPLLWQHSGLKPREILDRLVNLALERRELLDGLQRSR